MSDATSTRQGGTRLRRFVAYSILLHLGAGFAWGLPALLSRMAEQELVKEQEAVARNLEEQAVKAKEFARQQQNERTLRDIEQALRKEFDKLIAALPEAKREELWDKVAKLTAPESKNLAEAMNKTSTSEQDLRTLVAEMQRAMIQNLDEVITAESARQLADQYLAQVDSQVAPALADAMKVEMEKRVAQQMREEAEKLIAKQREDAKRTAEQAKAALGEAFAKVNATADAVKQTEAQLGKAAAQEAKTKANSEAQSTKAAKQLEQAAARLGEAAAKLEEAGAKATSLDGKAQEQVAASDKAIATARAATTKAAEAVQGRKADADAAVTAAQTALIAAQAATKSAIDAVAGQSDRTAAAKAKIHAAVEAELSAKVGRELTNELTKTTLPRLAGKLQEEFKKELGSKGLSDDALVAEVGKEAQARLAKTVPAMAQAGRAVVDGKFTDMEPAKANAPDAVAAAQSAAKNGQAVSPLDQALAEGLASMAENATKRIGEAAANSRQDAPLVAKAKQGMNEASAKAKSAESPDAAAMAGLRDSVGALARAASSGRLGNSTALNANISAVRAASISRAHRTTRSEAQYEEVTGQIAGRDRVQGERWTTSGAEGPASQAEAAAGDRPARVVGRPVAETQPALAHDRAYVPTFKTIVFATVPYFGSGFRIDGKLDKWDALPSLDLKTEHGHDRSRQVVKVAWSNAGLFVFCQITDPNRRIDKSESGNFWQSDSLELWIDAYNTKEKFRAKQIGQQFWVWPFGSASNPALTGGEAVVAVKKGAHRYVPFGPDRLERWAKQTPEGWVMEARIPSALITNADLAAGRIIGFNTYLNTMGGTDWYWSSGDTVATSMQPDTWGDLLLAGSDARIAVIAPGGGDGAKTVLPVGEPLRLRVNDDDMDLNPEARDKVTVSIRDGRGGRQNAVLEETGASSGVFEGAVSTALALDEPVPAVLSVFEGERVGITYIDQARANGAREATLSASVTFGSALMAAGQSARR